jgi:hypothetical protein
MKQIYSTIFILAFCSTVIFGQKLTQTIRGTITDTDNNLPLVGVVVKTLDTDPVVGASTDVDGNFRLENIPIGRVTIQLYYVGYESTTIPNIVVNSGKEVILNLTMQESTLKMSEVVITVNKNKGEALNDMALISARSISAEETNRYAGGFNDPSRIVSNFAGVSSTQDGGNNIIVRGNSPKYIQWRLEGVQITNPNHFGDQGAVGGGISTLNNNILATSDFYTGAFAPEYGDVLSGVYDVKLRSGNNEKREAVFGFGLLGTDLTLEGPFKKGYGGSYLINYRYSTASMASDLGLIDVGGIPKFQDAAFKIMLPTKKLGIFSVFGLAGKSSLLFEDVTPAIWDTPGDNFMRPDRNEDYKKGAHLLNTGINHTLSVNKNSYLKTTLSYANEGIQDDIFDAKVINFYDDEGAFLRDSVLSKTANYNGKIKKSSYRAAMTYHYKINAKNKIQIGTQYALLNHQTTQSRLRDTTTERITLLDFDENAGTLRNFVSWNHRINNDITLVTGFQNMNVLLNNKSTLEPRIAVNWKLNNTNSFHAGYGNHSTMENIQHYFTQIQQPDGSITTPNKDLGLLRANHYVVGYQKRFGQNLVAKVEAYYQDLYNLPVENDSKSFYATINEGIDFRYADLVNKGTGKNYGLEMTLERFFKNKYYYLINASLYESKYTSLEGMERNTPYNGNYLVNILGGKEFDRLGRKHNQALTLNAKVFFGGGQKIIPLLRDVQGNLAVDPANNKYWDYSRAYEDKVEDIYTVIVSASYKWNKRRATHELYLNLDNVTNTKGKISEFYDASAAGKVGYVTQFGFFPNLMYRAYF